MARPTKDVIERRDVIIRVRLTQTEKNKMLISSSDVGCNLSDYLRLKALDNSPRTKRASPERAAFITALAQLGKVGSNLNQIARALNRKAMTGQGDDMPDIQIRHVLSHVDTLTLHLTELLEHGH